MKDRRAMWAIGAAVGVAAVVLVVVLVTSSGSDDEAATTTVPATTQPTETTAAPPETTAAPPETTAAPPETTAAPPETTAAPPETTAAPPETTAAPDEPEGAIPESNSGWQLQLNPGSEDVTAGPVVVYWYRNPGSGSYIAVYTGAGVAGAEGQGLCPGNSIATTDFMHISNAPTEEGACDDFPTEVGSVQVCDHGVWIYETIIPSETEGVLFGSLEWRAGEEIHGMSSQAETAPDLPEFESGLASYSIAPWMTVDGATVIACNDALT